MKAVILAAGRGSRLGSETASVPKPLLPVGGRLCIDFAIEALLPVATSGIVVVTGYMAASIEAHIASHWGGAAVTTVRNPDLEAGNLTSLRAARSALGDDPFIVTNADHLFPADMYLRHFPAGEGIRIACEKDREILSDEMKVVDGGGFLRAISKTLPVYDGAYIGTTAIGPGAVPAYWKAFEAVESQADLATASVEMVLGQLAVDARTAPAICWIEDLRWYEVDTVEDLEQARGGLAA